MSIRTSLLSMSLASVCGVGFSQAATPQEILTRLAKVDAPAPLAPQQRALAMPALRYIPAAGTQMVYSMAHIGPGIIKCVGNEEFYDEEDASMLKNLGSVAISVGPGGDAALSALFGAAVAQSPMAIVGTLAESWADSAKPELGRIILSAIRESLVGMEKSMLESMSSFHMPPIYIAISPEPGAGDHNPAAFLYNNMAEDHEREMKENPDKASIWNEYRMMSSDMTDFFRAWLSDACNSSMPENAALREFVATKCGAEKKVHVLFKMQDESLIMIICADPAEITPPATPEQSMLYAPQLSALDAHGDNTMCIAWITPEMQNTLQEVSRTDRVPGRAISAAFTALGASDSADAPVFRAAAAGLARLDKFMTMPNVSKPETFVVWAEGSNTILEIQCESMGGSFKPGVLDFPSLLNQDNTFLYVASTSFVYNSPACDLNGLLPAVMDVGKGFMQTMNECDQDAIAEYAKMAEMLAPNALAIVAGAARSIEGLGDPVTLLVLDQDASQLPAVALSCGVTDRATVAAGWSDMISASKELAVKLGAPHIAQAIDSLPIIPRDMGNGAISYLLGPSLLPGFEPQVSVSNSRWVLGTSTKLNTSLMNSVEQPLPFAGFVASLNLRAVAGKIAKLGADHDLVTALTAIGGVHLCAVTTPDNTCVVRLQMEALPSEVAKALRDDTSDMYEEVAPMVITSSDDDDVEADDDAACDCGCNEGGECRCGSDDDDEEEVEE